MNIPVYILTIESDYKIPLEFIKNSNGINVSIYKGFDAKKLNDINILEYFDSMRFQKKWNYSIEKTACACMISHNNIYKTILVSEHDYAIILEDDFLCSRGIDASLFESIETPWDILILGYSRFTKKNLSIYNLTNPLINKEVLNLKYTVSKRVNDTTCGTIGYVIKKSYVEKLLRINNIPWFVADQWDEHAKIGADIMYLDPPLVWEKTSNNISAISSERKTSGTNEVKPIFKYTLTDYLKYPFRYIKYKVLTKNNG